MKGKRIFRACGVVLVAFALVMSVSIAPYTLSDTGEIVQKDEAGFVDTVHALGVITGVVATTALGWVGAYVYDVYFNEADVDGLNETQTREKIKGEVQQLMDRNAQSYTQASNRVTDMEQVALGKYQLSVAKSVCEGDDLSVAKAEANQVVNDHVSTIQRNLINHHKSIWGTMMANHEIYHNVSSEDKTFLRDGTNTNDPDYTDPGSYLEQDSARIVDNGTVTLMNEETVENVPSAIQDTPDSTNEILLVADYSEGSSLSSQINELTLFEGTSQSLELNGLGDYWTVYFNAQEEGIDVKNAGETYVEDIYNNSDNITKQEILDRTNSEDCDDLVAPNVLAGSNAVDTKDFAAIAAEQAGYNTSSQLDVTVEIYNNSSGETTTYEEASLVTRAEPQTTHDNKTAWVPNHQYNASDYTERITFYWVNDEGEVEKLELEDGDWFEIQSIDGANSLKYNKNKYKTYDSSNYLNELEETSSSIKDMQSELEEEGDGFPVPGGDIALAIVSVIVLYVVAKAA